MSSIPTDLSMNGINLFTENEIEICSIYNLKMLIIILIIVSLLYCISMSMIKTCDNENEQFGNDNFYSYKKINYSSYQSSELTPIGESLVFGQSNRYIATNMYILDVYCNLYILNGNIFGVSISYPNKMIKQNYGVYLVKDKIRKFVGNLDAGSDQLYKMQFKTDKVEEYVSFNNIEVVYTDENKKESTILKGQFISP